MATTDEKDPIDLLMDQVRALKASQKADQKSTKGQKDISKALSLFKSSLLKFEQAHDILTAAIGMLEGNNEEKPQSPEYQAAVAKYASAPYGRKTDGTPKKPSGKSVGTPEAEAFKKQYPELYTDAPAAKAPAKAKGKK